ncbi:hypothetical protein RDI58_032802 [Solanum bulbocastanum]|uniref:Uncharacterized protein n=1 Tax=Solanum bulbocastanum TaxID=147425 RepID=A0AAN8SLL3_SOLBU
MWNKRRTPVGRGDKDKDGGHSQPCAKSLSGSSYYIPSLLSISTVDAIEALNAISGGEDIPAATIGVDGTSSVRVRALAGITSASYLTVGGETTVRNVHVEAPLSSAAAVREGSLSLVHQKPSSTKAARSVLVSPKRRKEGHERHREDSRTRHDSDPEGCADQFDFSLCHLEIVCPELGYGVGRECQYISSSSSKAKISINSIILPLFASEAVSSLSRSSRSSKRSLLIPILLKEEVNRSRFLRTSVMEGAGRGDGGEAGST